MRTGRESLEHLLRKVATEDREERLLSLAKQIKQVVRTIQTEEEHGESLYQG